MTKNGWILHIYATYYNGSYLIGNTEVMVQVVTNLQAIFCTFWVCLRMLDQFYYYSKERVRIAVSWLTGLPAIRLIQNQGNSAIAWSITMRDITMMKVKSQRSTKFWITTRFSLLFCEKKLLKKSSIWSNLGSSKEENTGDQGCMWITYSICMYVQPGGPEKQLPQEIVGKLGQSEGDGTPQGAQTWRLVTQADSRVPHRQEAHLQQDPRRLGVRQGHGAGKSRERWLLNRMFP